MTFSKLITEILKTELTTYSFVFYCREGGRSNKMHQGGGGYQDFVRWGVFLGHSLLIIKCT